MATYDTWHNFFAHKYKKFFRVGSDLLKLFVLY